MLFGALGCGKSSVINLLAEEPIAPVSTNSEPCTQRPQCYPISIDGRRFLLWDTTGVRLPRKGDISPYEQAYTVLRDLPDGVHLILLCARKDEISPEMSPSLGRLYWLINNFFYGGRAPVAFVVTHFDTPDKRWWEHNQRFIAAATGIPIQSIPRICSTTIQTGCDQSRETLKTLLATSTLTPIPLCLDISSQKAASLDIAAHCRLNNRDAMALAVKLSRPRHVHQEGADTIESSENTPLFKKWLWMRSRRPNPDQLPRKSRRPTDRPPRFPLPPRVIATNEGSSTQPATESVRVSALH